MTCLQELRASGDTALLQGIPVCADGNVVLLLELVQRCGGWILISVSTGMRVCEKLRQTDRRKSRHPRALTVSRCSSSSIPRLSD